MANRIFIDMDGVIVDFDGYVGDTGLAPVDLKKTPRAYLRMKPIDGALSGVRKLLAAGFDVFLATKPPTGIAFAYADKAQWVFNYLPELERKLIITSDKGLLGDEGDILIDDRPHKANCEAFKGALITVHPAMNWDDILGMVEQATGKCLNAT